MRMTDADLVAFEIIANATFGEPGRVLKSVAAVVRLLRPGTVSHERSLPDGATLRRACSIIRTIEAESGGPITGRHKRGGAVAARHEAMRRLRDLNLSYPWIARLLDLDSHATVVMALQRDAAGAAEES